MNWSNDFLQLSTDFFACLVWRGSLYFGIRLREKGYATRRDLIDSQNMLLMGGEIAR